MSGVYLELLWDDYGDEKLLAVKTGPQGPGRKFPFANSPYGLSRALEKAEQEADRLPGDLYCYDHNLEQWLGPLTMEQTLNQLLIDWHYMDGGEYKPYGDLEESLEERPLYLCLGYPLNDGQGQGIYFIWGTEPEGPSTWKLKDAHRADQGSFGELIATVDSLIWDLKATEVLVWAFQHGWRSFEPRVGAGTSLHYFLLDLWEEFMGGADYRPYDDLEESLEGSTLHGTLNPRPDMPGAWEGKVIDDKYRTVAITTKATSDAVVDWLTTKGVTYVQNADGSWDEVDGKEEIERAAETRVMMLNLLLDDDYREYGDLEENTEITDIVSVVSSSAGPGLVTIFFRDYLGSRGQELAKGVTPAQARDAASAAWPNYIRIEDGTIVPFTLETLDRVIAYELLHNSDGYRPYDDLEEAVEAYFEEVHIYLFYLENGDTQLTWSFHGPGGYSGHKNFPSTHASWNRILRTLSDQVWRKRDGGPIHIWDHEAHSWITTEDGPDTAENILLDVWTGADHYRPYDDLEEGYQDAGDREHKRFILNIGQRTLTVRDQRPAIDDVVYNVPAPYWDGVAVIDAALMAFSWVRKLSFGGGTTYEFEHPVIFRDRIIEAFFGEDDYKPYGDLEESLTDRRYVLTIWPTRPGEYFNWGVSLIEQEPAPYGGWRYTGSTELLGRELSMDAAAGLAINSPASLYNEGPQALLPLPKGGPARREAVMGMFRWWINGPDDDYKPYDDLEEGTKIAKAISEQLIAKWPISEFDALALAVSRFDRRNFADYKLHDRHVTDGQIRYTFTNNGGEIFGTTLEVTHVKSTGVVHVERLNGSSPYKNYGDLEESLTEAAEGLYFMLSYPPEGEQDRPGLYLHWGSSVPDPSEPDIWNDQRIYCPTIGHVMDKIDELEEKVGPGRSLFWLPTRGWEHMGFEDAYTIIWPVWEDMTNDHDYKAYDDLEESIEEVDDQYRVYCFYAYYEEGFDYPYVVEAQDEAQNVVRYFNGQMPEPVIAKALRYYPEVALVASVDHPEPIHYGDRVAEGLQAAFDEGNPYRGYDDLEESVGEQQSIALLEPEYEGNEWYGRWVAYTGPLRPTGSTMRAWAKNRHSFENDEEVLAWAKEEGLLSFYSTVFGQINAEDAEDMDALLRRHMARWGKPQYRPYGDLEESLSEAVNSPPIVVIGRSNLWGGRTLEVYAWDRGVAGATQIPFAIPGRPFTLEDAEQLVAQFPRVAEIIPRDNFYQIPPIRISDMSLGAKAHQIYSTWQEYLEGTWPPAGPSDLRYRDYGDLEESLIEAFGSPEEALKAIWADRRYSSTTEGEWDLIHQNHTETGSVYRWRYQLGGGMGYNVIYLKDDPEPIVAPHFGDTMSDYRPYDDLEESLSEASQYLFAALERPREGLWALGLVPHDTSAPVATFTGSTAMDVLYKAFSSGHKLSGYVSLEGRLVAMADRTKLAAELMDQAKQLADYRKIGDLEESLLDD